MSHRIFMIAGEPSGDALGGALMHGLKEISPDIKIEGVGGALMKEQGLQTLLPMNELCVMGLWEVLGHLPRLLGLINAMVEEIESRKPDVFIGIDLPDFNFRVAEKLKKRGIFKGKIVHYVAPSVWAWRPGRAKKIAKFLDGIMCLFPFEPVYFTKEGLRAAFVGHPLIEIDKSQISGADIRQKLGLKSDDLCLGLFLGSRERELKTMSPILLETMNALYEQYPDMKVVVPTLPHLEYDVGQIVKDLPMPTYIVPDTAWKWQAFAACDVAVAVSGTVGLELAYAGVPHVIAYKMNPLTAMAVRMLIQIEHAHLANILLDRVVVPEFIQSRCTAFNITKEMMGLIRYEEKRTVQKQAFAEIESLLKPLLEASPSRKAASFIFESLKS